MKKTAAILFLLLILSGSAPAAWYSWAQIWGKDETLPGEIDLARAGQEKLLITGNAHQFGKDYSSLQAAVDQARAAGLKIIAQVYTNDLLDKAPVDSQALLDAGASAVKYDGENFGSSFPIFCANQPAWRDYLKDMVQGAAATGADGLSILHGDNLRGRCFGSSCEAYFRNYLRAHYTAAELSALGIADIDTFDYSDYLHSQGVTQDQLNDDSDKSAIPLFEDYLKMQDQQFAEFTNELIAAARSSGKEGLILINSREGPELARNIKFSSFEVYSLYSGFDPLGGTFSLKENNQTYLYKTARAMNPDTTVVTQPIDLSLGGIVNQSSDPEKYVYSLIAEALANQALFYDVRDFGLWNGEWLNWDIDPEINLKVKNFLQSYNAAFNFDSLQSRARIAVLYLSASQLKADRVKLLTAELSFVGISKALAKAGFQYDVIFNGSGEFRQDLLSPAQLSPYEIVVVPEPITLTANEKATLLSYAGSGGNLLVYPAIDPSFPLTPGETAYGSGKIYRATTPLPRYYAETAAKTYLDSIESEINNYLSSKVVQGITQTYINRQVWQTADPPRIYLQLVNHDIENKITNLQVTMEVPASFTPDKLYLASPDLAERELTYTQNSQTISFTVPELDVWDLLILTSAQESSRTSEGKSIIQSLAAGPSPAASSLTFIYRLSEPAGVKIRIYSISGEQLTILSDSYTLSGSTRSLDWDLKDGGGGSLSNGVYLYTLEAAGASGRESRARGKLIILR